jgi:hypothetical protein
MSGSALHLVAVCYSRGADVTIWRVQLDDRQRGQLAGVLSSLLELGHLAMFRIVKDQTYGWDRLIVDLGSRVGAHTVEACLASPAFGSPAPAFVIPVWPFDHEIDGAPASTGQFLGLDLQVIATPSPDQELGAHLPGHNGLWLIQARPMF